MTNIIKETLQKTLAEIGDQISHHEVLRKTHLTNKANQIAVSIDDLFKEFTIQVSDIDISFKLTEDSWHDFRIQRSTTYSENEQKYIYTKPTLATSSSSSGDEKSMKRLICLGKLAEHCLNQTNEWNELIKLMDESKAQYKANIDPLYKQFYQIERELNAINQEEQNKAFINIFSKGTFKLTKPEYYFKSDEFFWTANESGKTYTVSYIDERRTNPYYDENGNELEPIFERVKRTIDKRIKKADVESFVRSNMHLAAQ